MRETVILFTHTPHAQNEILSLNPGFQRASTEGYYWLIRRLCLNTTLYRSYGVLPCIHQLDNILLFSLHPIFRVVDDNALHP